MDIIDIDSTPEKSRPRHIRFPITPDSDSAIKILSSDEGKQIRCNDGVEKAQSRSAFGAHSNIEDQDEFFPDVERHSDAASPTSKEASPPMLAAQDQPGAADQLNPGKRKRKASTKFAGSAFELDAFQLDGPPSPPDDDFQLPSQAEQESPEKKSPKKKRGGRLTEEEKAARAAEKELQKQAKIQAREAKKKEKEAEKVQKQAQRAQNKLDRKRETGKTALMDTTLYLDPELAKHRLGRDIMQKLEDMYGVPGVEGPAVEICGRLPLWPLRTATWRRKVHKPTLEESGTEAQQIIPYQMLFFSAEEFVSHIMHDRLRGVMQTATQKCPTCTLGLLVEGLEHYLIQRQRKDFQAMGPGNGGFNRAFVDEFLGKLPCSWPGVRHVIVPDSAAAAEYIAGLTRAIAEQPFRAEAAYVMSFGAGKPDTQAASDLLKKAPLAHKDREIFFKSLLNIPRLGPQNAHAISGEHVSMGALIQSFQNHGAKESMLQGLTCFGGKRIGVAGSKVVAQVLTCEDPNVCI